MNKCFTINPLRTTEEFISYDSLFRDNIFQAIEIFYPEDEVKRQIYANNVHHLLEVFPNVKVILHLPFNKDNDLCCMEKSKELIEKFKIIIDFANQFQVKKCTMHLGYVEDHISRDIYINHIISVLNTLSDYAKKYDIKLMIENMPNIHQLGYSPDEILTIIQQVKNNNVGFIYDTGHAHVSEFPDLLYLDTLSSYLWHCHLNDNYGKKDEHQTFGKGNYDFASFFKKTHQISYSGFYCLEILYQNELDLRENAKKFDSLIHQEII